MDEDDDPFISDSRINLAKVQSDVQIPYQKEVQKLMVKDKNGKTGIRVLDDYLIGIIDANQTSFKHIALPRPDQILAT